MRILITFFKNPKFGQVSIKIFLQTIWKCMFLWHQIYSIHPGTGYEIMVPLVVDKNQEFIFLHPCYFHSIDTLSSEDRRIIFWSKILQRSEGALGSRLRTKTANREETKNQNMPGFITKHREGKLEAQQRRGETQQANPLWADRDRGAGQGQKRGEKLTRETTADASTWCRAQS